jgi:hypothetical protein
MRKAVPLMLVVTYGCWSLCPAIAFAKPAPSPPASPAPPSAEAEAGKLHFQQGVALYNDGNYSGALAEFEASYKAHPSPSVLYNVGLTLKALFRYTEAIAMLERVLNEDTKLSSERRVAINQVIGEMRALLADVTIKVAPDGASVRLDGRTIGTAPLPVQAIAAGNHVLEVNADGYQPGRRELMIVAGQPTTVDIKLAVISKMGHVHIVSEPQGAKLALDGKSMGATPLDLELPLGGHRLETTANDFHTDGREFVIEAGQTRDVVVVLKPVRYYERWWFWTVVGVVVAGGATTAGVVLSKPDDPIRGTLLPGVQAVK